jgi:HAD superfamily hydrolase (TIGR01509 family)
MSNRLKAVFFDLDETLVKNKIPVRELFARMYFDFEQQLGSNNKEVFFTALRAKAANLWSNMFESQISPEQQFVNCFASCVMATGSADGQQASTIGRNMFDHYESLSSNNVVFHDGAVEVLAELSRRGIITGLITNGMEQIQLGKVHALDIHNKVDHVTVSAQARAHKPHAPVFELALRRANVSAEQAIQIGDHATNDVAGAIRAGLGGVFYNPGDLVLEESFVDLSERPTHHIQHLNQVLDLI